MMAIVFAIKAGPSSDIFRTAISFTTKEQKHKMKAKKKLLLFERSVRMDNWRIFRGLYFLLIIEHIGVKGSHKFTMFTFALLFSFFFTSATMHLFSFRLPFFTLSDMPIYRFDTKFNLRIFLKLNFYSIPLTKARFSFIMHKSSHFSSSLYKLSPISFIIGNVSRFCLLDIKIEIFYQTKITLHI